MMHSENIDRKTDLYKKLSSIGTDVNNAPEWKFTDNYCVEFNFNETHIPELIKLATSLQLFNSELETEYHIPLYAMRILGQLKALDAIEPLIACFEDYYDSDYTAEDIPYVFAMIGKAAIKHLQSSLYIESKDDAIADISALCMEQIAIADQSAVNETVEILTNYLDQSNDECKTLNAIIISSLIKLKAVDKIDNIRNAFSKDIVDLFVNGDIEDAEIELELRKERSTPRPNLFPFLDFLNKESLLDDFDYSEDIEHYDSRQHHHHDHSCLSCSTTVQVVNEIKLGRNDLCHCGSLKKYKKCCIDDAVYN